MPFIIKARRKERRFFFDTQIEGDNFSCTCAKLSFENNKNDEQMQDICLVKENYPITNKKLTDINIKELTYHEIIMFALIGIIFLLFIKIIYEIIKAICEMIFCKIKVIYETIKDIYKTIFYK